MGIDFPVANVPAQVREDETDSSYLKAVQAISKQRNTPFRAALDRMFVDWIVQAPQTATSLGIFEPLGLHEHNRRLDDLSWNSHMKKIASAKANWIQLKSFVEEDLSEEERLTRAALLWQIERIIESEPFFYHKYPINQLSGVTQHLSGLFCSLHPLDTPEDREGYLERLKRIGEPFQTVIEILTEQRKKRFFPPRFAIRKVLEGLAQLNAMPVEMHPFYRRIEQQEAPFRAQVKKVLEESVYPAYQKLEVFLQNYSLGLKRDDGVWALPEGDAYYSFVLKKYTSLDLTAEEIHRIGLKEVARIEKEIRGYFAQIGKNRPEVSTGILLEEFTKDPKHYYPNTDEGRSLCLKRFEEILTRSREKLGPLFSLKPKAPVEVKRVPVYEEIGAPLAYYSSPSPSRPGRFYANLRDMNTFPKFCMETLAIHEGEPGHHYQLGVEVTLDMHPIRKLVFVSGYAEGWALYAEKLAYEEGFYSTHADVIGHLQDELWRAVRLVVDTGIHQMRWTREEAIDYMVQTTGKPHLIVESEVERYFVYPGQACAYKLGQLKMLDLRSEAKKRLGERFDLSRFHADMIQHGVLPLSLLKSSQ